YFIEDARVTTILASADLAPRLKALSGAHAMLDPNSLHDATSYDAARIPSPDADALQLYTSGTTGKPKGAILTHANLDANTALLRTAWGITESDILLHTLPLHHTHGLVVALLTTLSAGGHVRMLGDFDAASVWNEMANATTFMAVPTIYSKLFAAFDSTDENTRARWVQSARNLRLATSGSAALPVTLAERWREIAGKIPLERYGMTEIGMALSNPLEGERKPGFVGKPLPSVDTKIVTPEGGAENEGELWVRGPSVFRGYFEREQATREAFSEADSSGEKWFMTGDTVRRAEDGTLKILGRTSIDILKSGGYKLSALEIEEVLREHDAVAEVAVIGVPDEEWGDRVVACIVAAPGKEDRCATEEIRRFCKQKLAAYKVPKNAIVVEALPRNAMGKVVKAELVKIATKSLRG
ncbi:MAG: acyl-CoA synthetase, partial [Polyangiaceae bacterium]